MIECGCDLAKGLTYGFAESCDNNVSDAKICCRETRKVIRKRGNGTKRGLQIEYINFLTVEIRLN